MNDLPPSYEAATGIPVTQLSKSSAQSSEQTVVTQHTTTIPIVPAPQTIVAPQQQPQQQTPTQQHTNNSNSNNCRSRCQASQQIGRKCLCAVIAVVLFIIMMLIVALIAIKTTKAKYKQDIDDSDSDTFASIYAKPDYTDFDFDTLYKKNEELLKRLNIHMQEMPKFEYNNN